MAVLVPGAFPFFAHFEQTVNHWSSKSLTCRKAIVHLVSRGSSEKTGKDKGGGGTLPPTLAELKIPQFALETAGEGAIRVLTIST